MKNAYITLTGLSYRFGSEYLEPCMTVRLVKEPDNEYDKEAIRAELDGLGCIGYVANSVRTVLGECWSAGRLYDKIGGKAEAIILYKLPDGVVCSVALPECPPAHKEADAEEGIPF